MRIRLAICALSMLFVAAQSAGTPARPPSRNLIVYIGTYSGAKSKGIYAFRFDSSTGRLSPLGLVAETVNPSFLAIHPSRKFLYAVNEVNEFSAKKNNGGVSAFSIEDGGKLRLLNEQSTRGGSPCHLTLAAGGRTLFVANYGGGSVSVFPVDSDGRLGPAKALIQHTGSSVNKDRQEGPHAHGVYPDRSGRFVAVADLGLDRVMVYRFDRAGRRSVQVSDPPFASVRPGSGPRHFAFHPNGRFAYVNNEMSSTITVFAWEARKGTLKELQTLSTLPEGFAGSNSTAEIEVHPSGRFLYVSNRGHNSIAVFEVDDRTGTLKLFEHQPTQGKTPRSFGIDPTGQFLLAANQGSDTLVVFRIDPKSGRMLPTGHSVEVGAPVCVQFVEGTK